MSRKKQSITIRDIASKANVSYQAVSLVINDKPGVSHDTRERIRSLMEELDYRPNKIAQMLSTNRSKMLELIIVGVRYGGHLADTIKNMAAVAKGRGYNLLVSETEAEGLESACNSAASRLIDGIILYAPRLGASDDNLKSMCSNLPLVRRDYVPGSRIPWVGFDQVHATRLVVEHLIGLGHRHIAAIPPSADILNGYWRDNAWRNILLEHGLTPGASVAGDYSMKSGYEAAQKILALDEPFTALVTGTDTMALGAMRALREHGLKLPEDVSIASFDNTEFSSYIEPTLTTVDFKFIKQDETVIHTLIDMLETPGMLAQQRVLLPELIVRDSSRPPKAVAGEPHA